MRFCNLGNALAIAMHANSSFRTLSIVCVQVVVDKDSATTNVRYTALIVAESPYKVSGRADWMSVCELNAYATTKISMGSMCFMETHIIS